MSLIQFTRRLPRRTAARHSGDYQLHNNVFHSPLSCPDPFGWALRHGVVVTEVLNQLFGVVVRSKDYALRDLCGSSMRHGREAAVRASCAITVLAMEQPPNARVGSVPSFGCLLLLHLSILLPCRSLKPHQVKYTRLFLLILCSGEIGNVARSGADGYGCSAHKR